MATPVVYVAERHAISLENGATIDAEKGIVTGVRITGPRSASHKRKYPGRVTAAAVEKYAAPVNIGHHRDAYGRPVEVPPDRKFGRTTDPYAHADGINGTLRFNPEHQFAKPFVWACRNDQSLYSLSQLIGVRWQTILDGDGDQVAESILAVSSIDVVDSGGTTGGIFESDKPGVTVALDPAAVAAEITNGGDLATFLAALFANLTAIPAADKQAALDAVLAAVQSAPTDEAVPAAMEALRRCGKVGRWAAARLDGYFVAEAAQKRQKWAADLIAAEQVPDRLRSDLFTSIVAESFGNDARAKELIAERKKIGGTGKGGQVFDPPAGGKTLDQTIAEYVAG